jgi:Sulfotransferase family
MTWGKVTGLVERARSLGSAVSLSWEHRDVLFSQLKEKLATVSLKRPALLLFPQIQRSGGTLANQLFDGHPAAWSHPYEFQSVKGGFGGHPFLNGERSAMQFLRKERWVWRRTKPGYTPNYKLRNEDPEAPPFYFSTWLYQSIFDKLVADHNSASFADYLHVYFTAVSEAILPLTKCLEPKYVSAHSPRALWTPHDLDAFVAAAPDGKAIWLIRDPLSWFASAKNHHREYRSVDHAMSLWEHSVSAASAMRKRYPERALLVRFSSLINDTERVARFLAERLEIEFCEDLCRPTFNRQMVISNSRFEVTRGVVDQRPSTDRGDAVEPVEAAAIEAYARKYELAKLCDV